MHLNVHANLIFKNRFWISRNSDRAQIVYKHYVESFLFNRKSYRSITYIGGRIATPLHKLEYYE